MPNLSTVVLTDGTDNHSFSPRGIDNNGVASLVKTTGVPIGDERLTISRSRTAAGREKAVFKLTIPIVQDITVAGVTKPTVVRTAYADIAFSFDSTSSTQERHDIRELVESLVGSATATAVVDTLETLY